MKRFSVRLFMAGTWFPVIGCIFIAACAGNDAKTAETVRSKTKDTLRQVRFHKPPATYQDTVSVGTMVAVFYQSDSMQWDKTREILDANHYETEEHNCFFLMKNARRSLKEHWPHVRVVETAHARYLKFTGKNGGVFIIDLDTQGDLCGIYLFNGEKEPELADMMNIDTSLGFYFNK